MTATPAQATPTLGPANPSARCRQCRKSRPAIAVAHGDPFCSAKCARTYYGVVFPSDAPAIGRPSRGY